jgi:hypothetical protein
VLGVSCRATLTDNHAHILFICIVVPCALQDGMLCLHSLTNWELLCKSQLSDSDAVAAVTFHPVMHPSSSSSSSSSSGHSLVLFAAAGRELQQIVISLPAGWQAQQQQSSNSSKPHAAAAASNLQESQTSAEQQQQQQQQFELQVVARSVVSLDDISALAVNHQGTFLAAADDTGVSCCMEKPLTSRILNVEHHRTCNFCKASSKLFAPI